MSCQVILMPCVTAYCCVQSHSINMETFESEPHQAGEMQAAQAVLIVPLLDLSEQQQEVISVGMHLYYDMLNSVHHERQALNSQMTVLQMEHSSGNGTGASSSSSNKVEPPREAGSPNSANSSDQIESLPDRQELLEKQQELTSRLNLLLHKEVSRAGTALARCCWQQFL
jgi:hypothetical protein